MELLHHTTLGKYIGMVAETWPSRPALAYRGREWSYRQLWVDSGRIGEAFLSFGIRRGSHVGVWALDRPYTVLCLLALFRIGAVGVLFSVSLPKEELARRIQATDTAYLLFDGGPSDQPFPSLCRALSVPAQENMLFIGQGGAGGYPCLEDLLLKTESAESLCPAEQLVTPEDTDLLLFTSGTTSSPKAVVTTHASRLNTARMQATALRSNETDRYLIALPLCHCFSLTGNVLAALSVGACVQLVENRRTATLLDAVERYGCTIFSAVPTLFSAILARNDLGTRNLSSLRTGIIGGSPYPASLFMDICDRMGLRLLSSLGQTEATAGITASALEDSIEVRAYTVGRLFPHLSGRLVDPQTGMDAGAGQAGELCIRGFNVMRGYYRLRRETGEQFYPGGWLRTGDLARQDPSGNYVLLGRLKELIIRGGENITPGTVENLLGQHPDVRAVKVVGIPDPHYGEEVCALMVCTRSVDQEVLRGLVHGRLEPFCEPKYYVFPDRLPLTPGGKVDANACRALALHLLGKAPSPAEPV